MRQRGRTGTMSVAGTKLKGWDNGFFRLPDGAGDRGRSAGRPRPLGATTATPAPHGGGLVSGRPV